jgi:hypothetical protein
VSEYQNCMTTAMRAFPKGISKEERGKLFCAEAKVCSGKAKNKQEALAICAAQPPKEPKERKKRGGGCPPCNCDSKTAEAKPEPKKLPCPEATERALATMDEMLDFVKSGSSSSALELSGLLMQDISQCHPAETQVPAMTQAALDTLKTLGKGANGYYFKGEIGELKHQFELVKNLVSA